MNINLGRLLIVYLLHYGSLHAQHYGAIIPDRKGSIYVFAEVSGDSVIFNSYAGGRNFLRRWHRNYVVPLRKGQYEYVEILAVRSKEIKIYFPQSRFCECKAERLRVKLKLAENDQGARSVINDCIASDLDTNYHRMAASILQLAQPSGYQVGYFSDKSILSDTWQLAEDSFRSEYVKKNDNRLEKYRTEVEVKKQKLEQVRNSPQSIDSAWVSEYFNNYRNCLIDNRIFYELFRVRPDLYPYNYRLPGNELFNAFGTCPSQLTAGEVKELYNLLLPYKKSDNRVESYKSLWMLQSRAFISCP